MFDFAAAGDPENVFGFVFVGISGGVVRLGRTSRGGTKSMTLHEVSVGDRCTTRAESALGRE